MCTKIDGNALKNVKGKENDQLGSLPVRNEEVK
jgi:hypothetical protein